MHRTTIIKHWQSVRKNRMLHISQADRQEILRLEKLPDQDVERAIERHPEWKKIRQHAEWTSNGRMGKAACGCTPGGAAIPRQPDPEPEPRPHPGPSSYSTHRIGDIKSPPRGGVSKSGF